MAAQKAVEITPEASTAVAAKAKVSNSVFTELYTSGISVSVANTATNPLDMVKVRMQMAGRNLTAGEKRPGMVATGISVVKNEGVLALWSGLGPSLARGFFFGGARLGLYTPIKAAIVGDDRNPSFQMKVLSGSLSGGLAAAVTSPIELIKTRLQAAGRDPSMPNTSMGVIRSVVASDGVPGLWRGAMPGLIRSAILTACQCATYDEVKRMVRTNTGWGDGLPLHLCSSMIAGLVTTTVTNPIDVIKTRMFIGGKGSGGVMQTASNVLKNDGLIGFMKGWSASYARLGPHTVIMFLTAERLRSYAGLKNL
mmetsp:Transcript_21692/g.38771  ORF Transcript_21692/g.38771 Transcript_21692/m.38771 type:complete len:310 (-) Transcript_21692:793-1722(-)